MGKGRIEKSIINVIFSMGSSVVILVLSFISRTIFVRTLSTEYLGLNGLFTNILSFLSLAELGVGSALNYTCLLYTSECQKSKACNQGAGAA